MTTYDDLLHYFPYRYVDRSRIYTVSELERIVSGHSDRVPFVQLRGRITGYQASEEGRAKRLVARFADSTGAVDLVWFHGQKFILDKYPPGREYLIFGQPKEYMHEFSFIHPEIDPADRAAQVSGGLVPMYHTTELMKRATLHSRAIRDLIYTLLNTVSGGLPETLPAWILEERALAPLTESMQQIHFPESAEKLRAAQHRLKFEELFYIQLNILRTATLRRNKLRGIPCPRVGKAFNAFYANCLPFALTGAQKRVVHEIHDDMRSGRQMNRLLQGDVGSGKTLVALMAMLLAVDNGCQACLMAPTEILAGQHFATLQELLGDIGVRVELLTGSTTKRRRSALLPAVASGEVDILIGTHALIEDAVVFHRLGLSVIDEQHRFGVEQRSKLWVKSTYVPHVLIMTATPIPRTLAMTVYGDLDVSVIDELPPGRKPVKTVHRYDAKKAELYTFLRTEIGRTPARDRSSFHGSAALRWFRGAACGFRPRARRARLDVGLAGLSRTDLEPEPDRSQCGAWRVCLAGVGRLRCCTWEAGAPVGRGLFFVGMTGSSGDNCVWRSGSHVRSGGSTHMGTGPRPLLIVLFRMIPWFPPTPDARECATHPPPPVHEGHEDAGRAPPRPSSPHDSQPRKPPHPTHAPRPRRPDTPQPQHKTGPISSRRATDLEPEADRSRHGLRPISSRRATDLDAEPNRSRRSSARRPD